MITLRRHTTLIAYFMSYHADYIKIWYFSYLTLIADVTRAIRRRVHLSTELPSADAIRITIRGDSNDAKVMDSHLRLTGD